MPSIKSVTKVTRRHFGPSADRKAIPSVTLDFSPDIRQLPNKVYMVSRVFLVQSYYSRPYRCIKCWRLGHSQISCKSSTTNCRRCSGRGHSGINCTAPIKCINCLSTSPPIRRPLLPKIHRTTRDDQFRHPAKYPVRDCYVNTRSPPQPTVIVQPNFITSPPQNSQTLDTRPSGLWNLNNHPEFKALRAKVTAMKETQSKKETPSKRFKTYNKRLTRSSRCKKMSLK